ASIVKQVPQFKQPIQPQAAVGPKAVATLDYHWKDIKLESSPIPTIKLKGDMHLTLRSDGSYTFSGRLSNEGVLTVHSALAYAVKDSKGRVYMFTDKGHEQGW